MSGNEPISKQKREFIRALAKTAVRKPRRTRSQQKAHDIINYAGDLHKKFKQDVKPKRRKRKRKQC